MSSTRFYSKSYRGIYPNSKLKIFRKENNKIIKSNAENVGQTETQDYLHNYSKGVSCTGANVTKYSTGNEGNALNNVNCKEVKKKFYVSSNEYTENVVKVQMISDNLYKQIFPQSTRQTSESVEKECVKMKKDLLRHGIDISTTEKLANVNLKLPPLKGQNIEEHFLEIGKQQIKPYKDLIIRLLKVKLLPSRPKYWCFQEGWTAYDTVNGISEAIDFPQENGLIFDVEVCMSDGSLPTIATAVGCKYWYSWVSPRLTRDYLEIKVKQKIPHYSSVELIPLGEKCEKIVIGHNVSYDRARIREQYYLKDTKVRFLDTMSLHVSVSGVTSYQRAIMKSKKTPAEEDLSWLTKTSLNSLTEVHNLYCGGPPISKEKRNIFVDGTLKDVRRNFQSLMTYCSNDVLATHQILQQIWPLFEERFPHPVTLAGMLEMGSAYLPINKNWLRYIDESDLTYEELGIEAKYHLARRSDEACSLIKDEKYRQHLWMWDEDWSTQELKLKANKSKSVTNCSLNIYKDSKLSNEEKLLYKKFQYLYSLKDNLPARRPLLPGYPAWYRKLCRNPNNFNENDWTPDPSEITTGMHIAPKLLSLCWEGFPLHYIREYGWGFLVPFATKTNDDCEKSCGIPIEKLVAQCPIPQFAHAYATELEADDAFASLQKEVDFKLVKKEYYKKFDKNDYTKGLYKGSGVWCNKILDKCCFFLKLPHKNGISLKVGNPLSRDFLTKFSNNVLSSGESESNIAKRIIEISRMMSYWRNNRDRIMGQLVVWLSPDELPENLRKQNCEYAAICPQVVACGTLTRRAMEPTWMTASNSQKDRIGSELRAMVQAPPNYRIVGADVDSQELWIASVMGDAYAYRIHGATPLGWMTLSGTKSNGTDMHSITAKAVGISREHAKIINYARIYGAGQNFAEGLLKQFNPTLSTAEARSKASKMFAITKGKKVYKFKEDLGQEYDKKSYSGYEALRLASFNNKSVSEMFERPTWEGGTESAMFNCLEEIATRHEPVTPFLGCRLSRALETENSADENRFLPTRINWVVQSGAVDFLHLMLVSMRWLMGEKARFCLSFHDEVRYLVEEKYSYHAALAMHITNLLTRSYSSSRLGLYDLPMSVAFFSSVEVDSVLRKECSMDCKTPSNPHGLHVGYGILPGESLTIYDACEKAGGGDLSRWEWIK